MYTHTFSSLMTHPRLVAKKALAHVRRRIVKLPDEPEVKLIQGKVRYEFKRLPFLTEEDLRAMFTQSYDQNLEELFRQELRPGDIVLDAGSNVGYVAATAASFVGPTGQVHGFEPVKVSYERLEVLKRLNPEYQLFFNNVALGDQEGVLPVTYNPAGQARNATLVPGEQIGITTEIPVKRLDDYIRKNISTPERIKLVKIDVQGFEFLVLRGLEGFFGMGHRPLIACEIKPWVITKLGYTMADFEQYMKNFGYTPFDLVDQDKVVDITKFETLEIVLFRSAAAAAGGRK